MSRLPQPRRGTPHPRHDRVSRGERSASLNTPGRGPPCIEHGPVSGVVTDEHLPGREVHPTKNYFGRLAHRVSPRIFRM